MGRRKPFDPAEAAIKAAEKAEREAEIKRLRDMGASVSLDRGGKLVSARLSNVFTLLLSRGSITQNHHNAAYRLAEAWATWKGLDGKIGGGDELVDGDGGCREIVTDRMILAGRHVSRALASLDNGPCKLLTAFMIATVEEDRPMAWRGIVQRETGEPRRDEQTALVVGALEQLRVHYEGDNSQHRVAA